MYLKRPLGTIAALWGIAGFISVLVYAVVRMVGQTGQAITYDWEPVHFMVLVAWAGFMAYSEGYRGFQRAYSPRVAARALYLRQRSTPLRLMLAPLFCMGFFHAPRKRRITVVVLVVLIAAIVLVFQYIPQPWRGILDLGVILGLSWGMIATLVFLVKFWSSSDVAFDAEVIEPLESSDPSLPSDEESAHNRRENH